MLAPESVIFDGSIKDTWVGFIATPQRLSGRVLNLFSVWSVTLCIPSAAFRADKRVAARDMAHDWQPDFEQLVDEHQSMVFSLALRMTGDRGLAEEIAQDVFLELDRHLGRIESPLHASSGCGAWR